MSAATATVSPTTPDDEKKTKQNEITAEEKKFEEKLLSDKYATIA